MNGCQLREARNWAGMSRRELAGLLGVHVDTVANWESGRTRAALPAAVASGIAARGTVAGRALGWLDSARRYALVTGESGVQGHGIKLSLAHVRDGKALEGAGKASGHRRVRQAP